MNPRAKLRIEATHIAPPTPSASRETEPQARPKVMRRPAQFGMRATTQSLPLAAQADTHLDAMAAAAPSAQAPNAAQAAARNWPDDGRFAVALLAIVIAVNLLVTAWLQTMAPTAPTAGPGSPQPATADAPSLIDQLREAGANASEQ